MNYAECLNPFRGTMKAGIVGAPIDFRMPSVRLFACRDVTEKVGDVLEPVPSVGVRVLEFIRSQSEGCGLPAIRQALGIPPRRAVTVLRYLEKHALVEHSGPVRFHCYRVRNSSINNALRVGVRGGEFVPAGAGAEAQRKAEEC